MNYQPLLTQLGITPNYVCFYQLSFALEFVRQYPDTLLLITKLLYPAVAKEFNTSWKTVERNIRSAVGMAWRNNPELVCRLAGRPLTDKPKAAQFIAILANLEQSDV